MAFQKFQPLIGDNKRAKFGNQPSDGFGVKPFPFLKYRLGPAGQKQRQRNQVFEKNFGE